jgi:hypothetical protein
MNYVYYNNYNKPHTLCGKNVEYLKLNPGVRSDHQAFNYFVR